MRGARAHVEEIQSEEDARALSVLPVRHHDRPLLRGEVEPEVVVAEDGTVHLAPLEWVGEASDGQDQ